MEQDNKIPIWGNTDRKGRHYISFKLDGKSYVAYPNEQYEDGGKMPEYRILPPREEGSFTPEPKKDEISVDDIF